MHGAERRVWCEARRNIVFILSRVWKVRTFPIVQLRPLELGVLLSRYGRMALLIKTAVSVITNQLFSNFSRFLQDRTSVYQVLARTAVTNLDVTLSRRHVVTNVVTGVGV